MSNVYLDRQLTPGQTNLFVNRLLTKDHGTPFICQMFVVADI